MFKLKEFETTASIEIIYYFIMDRNSKLNIKKISLKEKKISKK
jgi:hypothetical protein